MTLLRAVSMVVVLGNLVWLATPVLAQADEEAVPLIMLKPQGAGFSAPRLRKLYATLKKRAGKVTSQLLPLTKTEVWMVPKGKADDVKRAAARQGVIMSALGRVYCPGGELNPSIWIARNPERRTPRGTADECLSHCRRNLSYLVTAHEAPIASSINACLPQE
jgi:hypothetical protein